MPEPAPDFLKWRFLAKSLRVAYPRRWLVGNGIHGLPKSAVGRGFDFWISGI
jgi:hypothetical protein